MSLFLPCPHSRPIPAFPAELYLAVNDIDHTKTKAQSPQTNGICERFHKTILNEFYQVAFRKKIYTTLEELQSDLDGWIAHYNNERTHQGKMCCGADANGDVRRRQTNLSGKDDLVI